MWVSDGAGRGAWLRRRSRAGLSPPPQAPPRQTRAGARPPCPRSLACLLGPPSPGGMAALEARGGAHEECPVPRGVRVPVGVAGRLCD